MAGSSQSERCRCGAESWNPVSFAGGAQLTSKGAPSEHLRRLALALCPVRAMSSCPARHGECKEPARIAQRHRARSVGLEHAHTGPTGCRGALTEFVKSVCCAFWVEQGSSTRVLLCADQARIEQRSKHIAQWGGQKLHLLVGESRGTPCFFRPCGIS